MRVVFLDKDGTLIENVPYNTDPRKIRICDRVTTGLVKLAQSGYRFIILSNQSGVARGYFDEPALIPVRQRIQELLLKEQIDLLDFLYCPHHPQGIIPAYSFECTCRKPKPGLFFQAAERYSIDLKASWMIGDILDDIEAGNHAGCRTVLVDNGNETEWKLTASRIPKLIAGSVDEAADRILWVDSDQLASVKRAHSFGDGI